MVEDRAGVVARLDALEAARKAATVIGLLKDDEHRARLDAGWAILQQVPDLLAAVRGVLDKHKPFYEYKGVRQEHTVNIPCADYDQCDGDWDRECDGSEDGVHEVAACAECQWTDGDLYGYATWPCPTVRDLAAALGEA